MTAISPSPESLLDVPETNSLNTYPDAIADTNTLDDNEDDQSISGEQPEDIGNDHHQSPDSNKLQSVGLVYILRTIC